MEKILGCDCNIFIYNLFWLTDETFTTESEPSFLFLWIGLTSLIHNKEQYKCFIRFLYPSKINLLQFINVGESFMDTQDIIKV